MTKKKWALYAIAWIPAWALMHTLLNPEPLWERTFVGLVFVLTGLITSEFLGRKP